MEAGLEDLLESRVAADHFNITVADLVLDVIGLEERPGLREPYLSQRASILPFEAAPGSSRFFFFINVSVSSIYRLPLLINKYKQTLGLQHPKITSQK